MLRALLVAVVAMQPLPILKDSKSASALAADCAANRAACASYLDGAAEELAVWNSFTRGNSLAEICPHPPLSRADVRRAFLRYLGEHPDDKKRPAALVLTTALNAAYPCD